MSRKRVPSPFSVPFLLVPAENNGFNLTGVWGASEDELFAVSTDRRILRWAGDNWVVSDPDVGFSLQGIGGSSAADVAAVGIGGRVSRRVGDTWIESQPVAAMTYPLNAVAGAAGEMYAVGNYGGIIHTDGGSWVLGRTPNPSDLELKSVWVGSETDVVAVGADRFLLEGATSNWESISIPGLPLEIDLRGVWGDQNRVFAVGEGGTVLRREAGIWTVVDSAELPPLAELFGISGADGVMMIVGAGGTVWRYAP